MTKLIPIQTYKLGTVPLSIHKINLVNTSMNPIDVLTNTSKVSMINKNSSVKPIKNIKNIKLNPNNLDISISEVESGGDYSAVNKHSGAMGKYQFQEEHLPLIKEVTGISNKEEFLNNPEKQEEFFNYWKNNVLIPETQRVRELGLGKDLNDEELASLLHFQGLPNTLKYLKGEKDMDKRYGHNISVNEYLNKTKNQTGGNIISPIPKSRNIMNEKRDYPYNKNGTVVYLTKEEFDYEIDKKKKSEIDNKNKEKIRDKNIGNAILSFGSLFDPTGISSYPSVYNTFKDSNSTNADKVTSVVGALPLIGKVKGVINLTKFKKNAKKAVDMADKIETFIEPITKVDDLISNIVPYAKVVENKTSSIKLVPKKYTYSPLDNLSKSITNISNTVSDLFGFKKDVEKTKNQTGGNLDSEDLTSKLLNFYKRENPELNDKDILIDLYYKSQSNQLKSGGNINEVVPIKMSSDSTAINVPINSSLYKDLYPNLYSYDKSQDIYSAAELPEVEIRAKRLPKGTYENHFNKVHKLIKQYEFNDDKAKEHADAIVTTGINKKIDPMFIAAMAQKESNFGANLTTPYNPLNYGNTDDGRTKSFPDYQTAYNTFGEYAIRNGLIKPGETTNDILKRGLKTQLGVYSTNPNYVKDIKKIYNSNMEKVKQPELPKIYLKK